MKEIKRRFLTVFLALLLTGFTWEIVFRPVLAMLDPELSLPPSMLEPLIHALLGVMGAGI